MDVSLGEFIVKDSLRWFEKNILWIVVVASYGLLIAALVITGDRTMGTIKIEWESINVQDGSTSTESATVRKE